MNLAARARQLRLFASTVRHLSARQIAVRASKVARRRWRRLTGARNPRGVGAGPAMVRPLLAGAAELGVLGTDHPALVAALRRAEDTGRSRFRFLNRTVAFDGVPDWRCPAESQLWRYHLHYFDYTRDLLVQAVVQSRTVAFATFRRLTESWLAANGRIEGDGWHPYTLSLRLVNWLEAAAFFAPELKASPEFSDDFWSGVVGQLRVLRSELEFDVRGNHLLENLRALIWCGVYLDHPLARESLDLGLDHLRRELREQVADDGGHFERSPGYHVLVTRRCVDIAVLLHRNEIAAPWLTETLRRMLTYLHGIVGPEQQVPLLKDTAWDQAPRPATVLALGAIHLDEPRLKLAPDDDPDILATFGAAAVQRFEAWPSQPPAPGLTAFPTSHHFVHRHERDCLVFDAGPVCPDYLPAHAHADLLSFELHVEGRRVVVDSGVFEYAAGVWRDYFRSTRAHNTVEIAEENQSEVWGSFRVARRARPSGQVGKEAAGLVLLQAVHDGYSRLPGNYRHRRTIAVVPGQAWVIVDEIVGNRDVRAASHLHFHPGFKAVPTEAGAWRLEDATGNLWLTALGQQSAEWVAGVAGPRPQGWYSERFGVKEPNPTLRLQLAGSPPVRSAFVLARTPDVTLLFEGGDLIVNGSSFAFHLCTDPLEVVRDR